MRNTGIIFCERREHSNQPANSVMMMNIHDRGKRPMETIEESKQRKKSKITVAQS